MNRLENKVAVITGASSGIGNSIARLFAAEGAKVVMFARREKELNDTAAEITANGGVAVACPGDVSVQADVERALNTAIEKFGKVDIVVNDAGMVRYNGGVAVVTDDECMELYAVNTMGALRFCREAMKYMLPAGKGNFVFIGSVGGLLGHGGTAYAMTKGGMVSLARQIAVDYHREGIRSNVICPDGVMTMFGCVDGKWDMDPHTIKATTDHVCPDTPLCTPEEVANLALFLASDESEAVNGQAIVIDPGANL